MKILLCTLFLFFQLFKVSSQEIKLKEVKVFPENFAHEVISKMKFESNKNLKLEPIKCIIEATSIKNSTDTVADVKQLSYFKLNAFKLKKYKIDVLDGYANYKQFFFSNYFIGDIEKYRIIKGRVNELFAFEYLDFLNDFSNYQYQISQESNYYIIDFKSKDKFEGSLKVDKFTFNLLKLNFNNVKSNLFYYSPSVGNLTKVKYVKEVVKTETNIDTAIIYFEQDSNGKISLSSLESKISYSKYKISKYKHDNKNRLISEENMLLSHILTINKL